MYKLGDLPSLPPAGLAPWHDAIEDFMSHLDYMGSWDGVDHKEMNREIVVMEYTDVPTPVRNWIEEQQADPDPKNKKKWFYGVFEKPKHEGERIFGTVGPRPSATPAAAGGGQSSAHEGGHGNGQEHPSDKVQPTQEAAAGHHHQEQHHQYQEQQPVKHVRDEDKIVVFPGAAVYEIAPLWVAQGSGACERELNNISKFKPQAIDHAVIAWVTDHTKPMRDLGKRDIQFTVEAMAVTETEDGKYTRQMWERMYRSVRREERKQLRKERERAKRDISEGITRDEL